MATAINLTQEQFEQIATDVVGVIVAEAAITMQRKIIAAGYVLTGELLDSIRHEQVVVGASLYAEFTIGFSGHGRFKDMRQLLYGKMPPIDVIEEYVRELGLDKFKYVPGYLLNAKYRVLNIPDSRAVNRIAWGIAVHRMQFGVKGQRKNAFYNPTRGKLMYETAYKMLERMPEPILQAIKQQMEA